MAMSLDIPDSERVGTKGEEMKYLPGHETQNDAFMALLALDTVISVLLMRRL
jgi:hypothetical protein